MTNMKQLDAVEADAKMDNPDPAFHEHEAKKLIALAKKETQGSATYRLMMQSAKEHDFVAKKLRSGRKDSAEADDAAPAKGWSIKIKGKFYPIPNDSDNSVDGAIKKAGLWKKGGTYPDFEIYHDGEWEGGGGGGNSGRMDSAECDTIYQEKGEFFFRKPGFRDAYGPFASEDEANEAAVRAGVIADGMDPITLMADAQADDSRTPDEKLAVAKRTYEQDLKSASGPAERAQVKEDFESFKKAMIKAGARADADDPCWEGYRAEGMKEKDGKTVPNCIPDAAPQPLIAEDRKYWKRECRDRIQDATASIKSYEEDLKRAESKLANLGTDAKPIQKQSLQADVRDYKDLIRQQRMRLKSAQETLEMVDKPNTTSEQIEAVWRKKKYADSSRADSTPTIVREGDQWIIVVTDGAEKSVFRLGVREYPTEAEALEYATTNPQYTNNKPTSALDSLMAACDSLYAKADEVERRLDDAGDQRFSVVYTNSVDREATIVVRAKHNVDAKKVAKEQLGGEIKEIRRVEQLPDRK